MSSALVFPCSLTAFSCKYLQLCLRGLLTAEWVWPRSRAGQARSAGESRPLDQPSTTGRLTDVKGLSLQRPCLQGNHPEACSTQPPRSPGGNEPWSPAEATWSPASLLRMHLSWLPLPERHFLGLPPTERNYLHPNPYLRISSWGSPT